MENINLPEHFAENLAYLRSQLGYDINRLAAIVDIDPIDLHELETQGVIWTRIKSAAYKETIVSLCNYFTIRLGNFQFDSIQSPVLFGGKTIRDLIQEQESGIEIDRSPFYQSLVQVDMITTLERGFPFFTPKAKYIRLWNLIHQFYCLRTVYRSLRKKGLVGRMDDFEQSME